MVPLPFHNKSSRSRSSSELKMQMNTTYKRRNNLITLATPSSLIPKQLIRGSSSSTRTLVAEALVAQSKARMRYQS